MCNSRPPVKPHTRSYERSFFLPHRKTRTIDLSFLSAKSECCSALSTVIPLLSCRSAPPRGLSPVVGFTLWFCHKTRDNSSTLMLFLFTLFVFGQASSPAPHLCSLDVRPCVHPSFVHTGSCCLGPFYIYVYTPPPCSFWGLNGRSTFLFSIHTPFSFGSLPRPLKYLVLCSGTIRLVVYLASSYSVCPGAEL